jgi:hypothetical protein
VFIARRSASDILRYKHAWVLQDTKGKQLKIDTENRTPGETLEKRLEERQVTLVDSHKARHCCVDRR